MHFVIYCLDKDGHADVRTENRPQHVEYLKASADAINGFGIDEVMAALPAEARALLSKQNAEVTKMTASWSETWRRNAR